MARGALQIVLTGGGASLVPMCSVAERILGLPTRLGFPRGIQDWPENLKNPAWSTAAGLTICSAGLKT